MKLLYTLFFLTCFTSYSQGEANNWYFGERAGLSFGTTPPTPLNDGKLSTLEGCTSISDATGNLLFYTDGSIIYTKEHEVMRNGNGLKGDFSSTTSALIVPQPNQNNRYIVFTVDEPHHLNADNDPNTSDNDGINNGLQYSIVDMNLDNGKGAVVSDQKNIPLITYDPNNTQETLYKCSEKITAVKSDDCNSFWVITHFIDTYYAFKIDKNGVNETPVRSKTGVAIPISGYRRNAIGYLKASSEGDKLAVAHLGLSTVTAGEAPGKVLLYDFDNATGMVSKELELYNGDAPYGIEFSQSGQRLYASIGIGDNGVQNSFIIQYDLSLPRNLISDNGTKIKNENGSDSSSISSGALQIGPDGKIYRALFDFQTFNGDFLGVIENPEDLGAKVRYKDKGILINTDGNRGSRLGLPPFIQSIFAKNINIISQTQDTNEVNIQFCEGDTFRLSYDRITNASYSWFKDDNQISNSNPFLDINQSGNYRLEVDLNDGSCPLIGSANATFSIVPNIVETPKEEIICKVGNQIISTDLSQYNATLLGNQDPDQFDIKYFESLSDAESGKNALPENFVIKTNPQPIVARVENKKNTNCFVTADFEITLFDAAVANPIAPIVLCDSDEDGDDSNGSVQYDLTLLNSTILGSQNSSEFALRYYLSFADAQNNQNPILDPSNTKLTNISPNVYARVENKKNTKCFDISTIPVTIKELPEAIPTVLIQCPNPDIPSELSLFNLNEASFQITGGNSNTTVLFFEDENAAIQGISEITNPTSFQNTTPNQVLFAKVINSLTNCNRITSLKLETSTTKAKDAILLQCDDDGIEDGIAEFDLTLSKTQILEGLDNTLNVKFYTSLNDALIETNDITRYRNTGGDTKATETIYARVESQNNQCFAINQVALIVNPLPKIKEQEINVLCVGENIMITSGLERNPTNATSFEYLWSTGETTEEISVTEGGDYTVTVTNMKTLCSKDRFIEVIHSAPPTSVKIKVNDVNADKIVNIRASGPGDYEYAIAINNSDTRIYQDDPEFRTVPPGIHTVYVRDKNGCSPETIEKIAVLGLPQFFSPNGDGIHETWGDEGFSQGLVGNSRIFIYDRNGKLLKQITPNNNQGWDGTFNGHPLPSSEYWYSITLEDGTVQKGSFSLIR